MIQPNVICIAKSGQIILHVQPMIATPAEVEDIIGLLKTEVEKAKREIVLAPRLL